VIFQDGAAEVQFKHLRALVHALKPRAIAAPPVELWRRCVFTLVHSQLFNVFISVCICINILFIMAKTSDPSDLYIKANNVQEILFITIFVVEIALKLVAVGWHFFRETWYVFDFLVILGSLIGLAAPETRIDSLCRLLRIVRIMRLSPYFGAFALTLQYSIHKVINTFIFMVMLIYSYAILGMEIWPNTRYGLALDEYSNFRDFRSASTVLLRAMLGEWVVLRYDCNVKVPNCTADEDCGSVFATMYFVTYTLITTFVVINMLVAVVLDNFAWTYSLSRVQIDNDGVDDDMPGVVMVGEERIAVDDHVMVSKEDLELYTKVWKWYDPTFSGRLQLVNVGSLIDKLAEEEEKSDLKKMKKNADTLGSKLDWQNTTEEGQEYMATLVNELQNLSPDEGWTTFEDVFLAVAFLELEKQVKRKDEETKEAEQVETDSKKKRRTSRGALIGS